MIGDTVGLADLSATIGDLPDATSHITTLVKVNQDQYSSEYRFRGTSHDYVLKIRNTLENRRPDGVRFTRHNLELTMTRRADPEGDPPLPAVPYITSCTLRFPEGGSQATMLLAAGHLLTRVGGTLDASALMTKLLNFES